MVARTTTRCTRQRRRRRWKTKSSLTADEDDEENRERNARMEALQREIDFIRDKIASISQEDYEYDEKENVERFDDEDDVIRRRSRRR